MIDECITFIFASTQTTATMTTNCIHYLIANQKLLQKVRDELKQELKVDDFKQLTNNEWKETLSYEVLGNLRYSGNCLTESLRIEPPSYRSTPIAMTEDIEVKGITIPKGLSIEINMR